MNIANIFDRMNFRRAVMFTVAAIGLAASPLFTAPAQAGEARKSREDIRFVYLAKYRVNGDVRYSKQPRGKLMRVSVSQYRTSNSYVCTPSGFGQKSHCHTANQIKEYF
ncbi:hypothetical protein BR10RB9215_C20456 [Brucella sp. 10RB9215]|uniref:hypothetical protein n=1 Tax=Brucella TaxID=234 RepID=UPI00084FA0DA|nr:MULTISPECIES: hypothetical protein [Brucella]APY15766.1 hypothetical protein BKD02_15995 [Brucella sp. 09RB8910]MRN45863.1 hypothetical protein [Brucella sp. 10RB9212]MRN51333.1 hypothetical protein [Brucella sp. 10RB9214]MRN65960.1 hypothetical protein [Brucella sp. 10RB9213]OEI83572.1 hypothetical protein BA060_11140 [Brucella sp. B13-0095]